VDRHVVAVTAAAVTAMAAAAWLVSFGGHLKVAAQLSAAAGPGGTGDAGPKVVTGTCPEKWAPHVPAGAWLGRHRMYRHPAACSQNLNAPQQVAYDWMFTPPSEGDL
jgi:hypothetical protein